MTSHTIPYPKTRLFVESALQAGASVPLPEKAAHYLAHVLRLKADEPIALFNGADGEWLADISELRKKSGTAQVMQLLRPHAACPDVEVAFAPIKFGKIDFIAQKASELGAAILQPVVTRYTQMERVNVERLQANATEAAQQCERTDVPTVKQPMKFIDWLANHDPDRVLIYGDETGQGEEPSLLLPKLSPDKWSILVGPEGGFAEDELALLRKQKQSVAISLGPRILRADTAMLTLLSLTQAWFGDWQRKPAFRSPSEE